MEGDFVVQACSVVGELLPVNPLVWCCPDLLASMCKNVSRDRVNCKDAPLPLGDILGGLFGNVIFVLKEECFF